KWRRSFRRTESSQAAKCYDSMRLQRSSEPSSSPAPSSAPSSLRGNLRNNRLNLLIGPIAPASQKRQSTSFQQHSALQRQSPGSHRSIGAADHPNLSHFLHLHLHP